MRSCFTIIATLLSSASANAADCMSDVSFPLTEDFSSVDEGTVESPLDASGFMLTLNVGDYLEKDDRGLIVNADNVNATSFTIGLDTPAAEFSIDLASVDYGFTVQLADASGRVFENVDHSTAPTGGEESYCIASASSDLISTAIFTSTVSYDGLILTKVVTEPDVDADGYAESAGDCNDESVDVYPGAEELNDDLDNDCNGQVDEGTSDTGGDTSTDTGNGDTAETNEDTGVDTDSANHTADTNADTGGDCDAPGIVKHEGCGTTLVGTPCYSETSSSACSATQSRGALISIVLALSILLRRRRN